MTADPPLARREKWTSAATLLAIDAVAAEVCNAFREHDVPVAVLKGPVLARELYEGDASRTYRDADLLVPGRAERDAYDCLRDLGFVPATGIGTTDPGVADEHQWLRDGVIVEVHVTLVGVGFPAGQVWGALERHLVTRHVGGSDVLALDVVGLALHVALHAAQHGVAWSKAIEDLDRALDRWTTETWVAAASLAADLDASAAFDAGLRLRPAGAAMADLLGLRHTPDIATALRVSSAPDAAFGLDRMLRREGKVAKLTYVLRSAFPSPAFMRWWSPWAGRGPIGLAAAYAYRPIWLVMHAPAALSAYLRARRGAGQHGR